MPDLLANILERRLKHRHYKLPWIFWHTFWDRKNKRWKEDRYRTLNRFTERLCEKADVPEFKLQQLRHLATAILKENGDMSLAKLQRFLRHEHQTAVFIVRIHEIAKTHISQGFRSTAKFCRVSTKLGYFWGVFSRWRTCFGGLISSFLSMLRTPLEISFRKCTR
jgi:hypothetical protein